MSYNGWKNRETWNVALWIGNDERLYQSAVQFMKQYCGRAPYRDFVWDWAGIAYMHTPDGVSYYGKQLSLRELNGFMRELKGE